MFHFVFKNVCELEFELVLNYYIIFKTIDIRKKLLCIQTKIFNNGPGMYKKNIF